MSKSFTETPWQLVPGFELLWREWDGELVVYNTGSGDTHLLNILAASLLQHLKHTSANIDQLAEYAISTLDITPDEDLITNLKNLFLELERSGLVERLAK